MPGDKRYTYHNSCSDLRGASAPVTLKDKYKVYVAVVSSAPLTFGIGMLPLLLGGRYTSMYGGSIS